ncbi:MAG: endonuclease NucS domain-containing protein [Chitinispirillaceae bacterium]
MSTRTKQPIWQMIREGIEARAGKATISSLRDWVLEHYPGTNANTVQCQIIVCTVNHESRIHYPENQKPRKADTEIDFLFRTDRGRVELYDPRIHGNWEIAQDEHGFLQVHKIEPRHGKPEDIFVSNGFIQENQLLTYLAKHLEVIEEGLEFFVDDAGNDGFEYQTDIGRIDLLAVDREGGLIVVQIEKVYSAQSSSGQLLGFRNWVKKHVANGRKVRAYLIGSKIPDTVRYALSQLDDVFLKEYELNISLRDVPIMD